MATRRQPVNDDAIGWRRRGPEDQSGNGRVIDATPGRGGRNTTNQRPGDFGADARFYGSQELAEQRIRAIAQNSGTPLTDWQVRQAARQVLNGNSSFGRIRQNIGYDPMNPGGGGGGGAPVGEEPGVEPPPAEEPTKDFYAEAKALFPWLPDVLLRAYASGWASSNDPAVAWGYVRQSREYDTYFAGNRRADGTFRMTEMEYMATKDGYRQTLRDYGVSPDLFEERHTSLIENDVSLQEFRDRLDGLYTGITANTPQVQATFQAYYGMTFAPEAMQQSPQVALAMALDPSVGRALLERRISVAQVGGEAAARGFARSASESERLVSAGITQGQARQLYSQAESQLPTLDALAKRWRDRDDTFGTTEFEDMAALGDAGQQRRAQRLVGAEQSSFSGQQGRVDRDQSGGLSGLRAR